MARNGVEHPANNYVMTQWARLNDTIKFNQVPFGVYAITKPTDILPSNRILPFDYEDTIYFGKSGNSYDDFFFDRKDHNPLTNKERFHRYSLVEKRLKSHRHNLLNNNSSIDRGTSYQKFYENFGYGEDVISKVNVCVIVPKSPIPNFMVPSWLLFMESYFVYLYQMKFGKTTLMNISHSETKKDESSASYNKKQQIENTSLSRFNNG